MSMYHRPSFLQRQSLRRKRLVRLVSETTLTDPSEIDLAEQALSLHLDVELDSYP